MTSDDLEWPYSNPVYLRPEFGHTSMYYTRLDQANAFSKKEYQLVDYVLIDVGIVSSRVTC